MKSSIQVLLILSFSLFFSSCDGNKAAIQTEMTRENDKLAYTNDSTKLQKGISLLNQKSYEEARKYLLSSSQSTDIAIQSESFLYLNALEIDLENYSQSLYYLEEYHRLAMILFGRAVEAEKEIRNHKENIYQAIEEFDKQQNKSYLVSIFIVCAILITGISIMLYYNSKKKHTHLYLEKTHSELKELNSQIESNKNKTKKLRYNTYLIQADVFMKTSIYEEILELGEQKKGREMMILNNRKQNILDEELNKIFREFIDDMMQIDSNLTENDLKLCCLSLLPLNSRTKAICYGSTEINIIKQRKHQIKKKMSRKPENLLLFDFIFTTREQR